eukprot:COSAG05_NODE_104_length_18950_cov_118.655403_5_plen_144_part_00
MEIWKVGAVQQQTWARTYARAVAGTPLNMSFKIASPLKHFQLCFSFSSENAGDGSGTDVSAETEIFASQTFHYPLGLNVITTSNLVAHVPPPHCVDASPSCDVVLVHPTTEAAARLRRRDGRSDGAEGAKKEVGCVTITAKLL